LQDSALQWKYIFYSFRRQFLLERITHPVLRNTVIAVWKIDVFPKNIFQLEQKEVGIALQN